MTVEDRTTCSSLSRYCAYCGRKLPPRGEGARECPEREDGKRDKAKYGQVSGELGGL